MPASSASEWTAPLLSALEETGAIGSTTRQLADRVHAPPPEVAAALDSLRASGAILRIGRGLFILSGYGELTGRADFVEPASYVERFTREGGPPLGRREGRITFSRNDELPIHRWWPYVQGYSAEFVAERIAQEELPRGSIVLDPFAGSGTTLVEARWAGHRAVGVELLPNAALAARVKTRFELDPEALVRGLDRYLRRVRRARNRAIPFLRETRRQFSPAVLATLARLRACLPNDGDPLDEALRLAFGKVLIPMSRLRRSPCLGYGGAAPTDPEAPFTALTGAIGEMADDLRALRHEGRHRTPRARVHTGDARSLSLPSESVALAVTSPPYVNGMDYVMNYKLDLAWLNYATGYPDLAQLRHASVACDNLPRIEAGRFSSPSLAPDPWLPEILRGIERNVERKGSYRRGDVHGVVNRYFLDVAPVLSGVYRSLRPGGRFTLVVGDSLLAGAYVPGDLLLARMGARAGFTIESVDIARSRRSGQRRSFRLRESIVTLRRPRAT